MPGEMEEKLKALKQHFEQGFTEMTEEGRGDNLDVEVSVKDDRVVDDTETDEFNIEPVNLDQDLVKKQGLDRRLSKKRRKKLLSDEQIQLKELAREDGGDISKDESQKGIREDKIRDLGALNLNAEKQQLTLKNEAEADEKERLERLRYLAEDLVKNMKIFYGGKDLNKKEASDNLKKNGIRMVTRSAIDDQKDNSFGNFLANKLGEFFLMESGLPAGWEFVKSNLTPLGLTMEELLEAREKKNTSVGKISNATPGIEKILSTARTKQTEPLPEMSFEDKVKRMEMSGGTLVKILVDYAKKGGER